jgi:hypothetical protein
MEQSIREENAEQQEELPPPTPPTATSNEYKRLAGLRAGELAVCRWAC